MLQTQHDLVGGFPLQEYSRHHRDICKRENKGAEDGKENGHSHGTEHLSLDTHQGHHRQIDNHDDHLSEGCRLTYSTRRFIHQIVEITDLRVIPGSNPRHHGFYDDDGTVNNHTKVDGTKTHQVAADIKHAHHTEGKQHRQRDDRSHNKSGPIVSQEKDENEDDNETTLHQVACNGVSNTVNQQGAVNKWLNDNTLGKTLLNIGNARLHILDDLLEILASQHQRDTSHYLAFTITGHGTVACGMSEVHLRHITHQNGHTALGLHHDFLNVVQRLHQSESSNIILIGKTLYVTAASIFIVLVQSSIEFGNRHAHCIKALQVYIHLILLHITAPATDLGNTWRTRQLFSHDPILNGSQVGERVFILIPLLGTDGIMVYFTQTGRDRCQFHIYVIRQFFLDAPQLLVYQFTRPIVVSCVVEDHRDNRHSATADAPPLFYFWNIG